MLNAKEGQTYVCIKSDRPWWSVGKEYKVLVTSKGKQLLVDDDGARWQINYLKNNHAEFKLNLHAEFKLKESQSNATEGQTFVCKRDMLAWWTLGKEYTVQKSSNGLLYLTDDERDNWYLPNDDLLNTVFKLKEQTFDLNKLTTEQLREYVELLEDKENTAALLNDFIERMSN